MPRKKAEPAKQQRAPIDHSCKSCLIYMREYGIDDPDYEPLFFRITQTDKSGVVHPVTHRVPANWKAECMTRYWKHAHDAKEAAWLLAQELHTRLALGKAEPGQEPEDGELGERYHFLVTDLAGEQRRYVASVEYRADFLVTER